VSVVRFPRYLLFLPLLMTACDHEVPVIKGVVSGYSYEAKVETCNSFFGKSEMTITVSFYDKYNHLVKRLVDQGSGKLDDQLDDRVEYWGRKGHVTYDLLKYVDEDGAQIRYATATGGHPVHKFIDNASTIALWNDAHLRFREMSLLYAQVQKHLQKDLHKSINDLAYEP